MRKWIFLSLVLGAFPPLALAEEVSCENPLISVTGRNSEFAQRTCEAVKYAEALFQRCNVPPFRTPIKFSIVEGIEPGCVAQLHCGEDWIEILEPPAMDKRRSPDGAFGFLPIDAYFQSVVVHELAHAVYDHLPCPLQTCIATNEYVAYAMQVMSLKSDDRLAFQNNAGLDREILDDELNAVILSMAQGVFARRVWAHLSQREDMCGYIGQITSGTVFLDRDMP